MTASIPVTTDTPGIQAGRCSAQAYRLAFADCATPLSPVQAVLEAERCYYCFDAPCTRACPAEIDVPAFIQRIAQDNVRGAAQTILQANAKADPKRCTQGLDCLSVCGLRDGLSKVGQFCIDLKLSSAFRGEVGKGLFFRGSETLPFGHAIRSVKELMDYLLTGVKPANLASA